MQTNLNIDPYPQQAVMQAAPINFAAGLATTVASTHNSHYHVSGPLQQNMWGYSQDQQHIHSNGFFDGYYGPPELQLFLMPYDGEHGLQFRQSRNSTDVLDGYYNSPGLQSPAMSYDRGNNGGFNDSYIQHPLFSDPHESYRGRTSNLLHFPLPIQFVGVEDVHESSHANPGINPVSAIGADPALSVQPGDSFRAWNPHGLPESGVSFLHNDIQRHNADSADAIPKLHQLSPADEGRKESMSETAVGESIIEV